MTLTQPDGQPPPPPQGLPAPDSHGAGSGEDRPTRKPMAWWDRVKFLVLFVALFWFFVWADLSDDNPFNTFGDALKATLASKR